MIKFDPNKLTIEIVKLKSVTTALGGSITVVDETNTSTKEKYKRITIPQAVTQSFIKKTHKRTKYLKPVFTALVKYEDFVVAMEAHPLSSMGELITEGLFGPTKWVPQCEAIIDNVVKPLIIQSNRQWYFDGRYIYSFDAPTLDDAVRDSEHLSQDGSFRKVVARSLDVQDLSATNTHVRTHDRSCLAFVTSKGTGVLSPPIWKNLSDIGTTQLRKASSTSEDDDDEEKDTGHEPALGYCFDKIDGTLSVNLNFALKAGKEIGKIFGYERVEPLRLPQLMVELCTVNLPNIPSSVKATYDIGLKFTHTIGWLLGLSRDITKLEDYIALRSLLKYLTKRGIFRNNVFNADRIFKGEQTVSNVPFLKLDELMNSADFTQLSLSALIAQARSGTKARKDDGIHSIDTLVNEE